MLSASEVSQESMTSAGAPWQLTGPLRSAVKSGFFCGLESGKEFKRGQISEKQYAERLATQVGKGAAKSVAKSAARDMLAATYGAARESAQASFGMACASSRCAAATVDFRSISQAAVVSPPTMAEVTGSSLVSAMHALGIRFGCAAPCYYAALGVSAIAVLEPAVAAAGAVGVATSVCRTLVAIDQLLARGTEARRMDDVSSATLITKFDGLISSDLVITCPTGTTTSTQTILDGIHWRSVKMCALFRQNCIVAE
mmetsp:Transcript_88910/g.223758  ORF Transcript_88910/g.223758 Transcript_88910/m.223758 type:complete len:256 (+) Transcript_88910:87-854(+)